MSCLVSITKHLYIHLIFHPPPSSSFVFPFPGSWLQDPAGDQRGGVHLPARVHQHHGAPVPRGAPEPQLLQPHRLHALPWTPGARADRYALWPTHRGGGGRDIAMERFKVVDSQREGSCFDSQSLTTYPLPLTPYTSPLTRNLSLNATVSRFG